jgi:hypothetical protein
MYSIVLYLFLQYFRDSYLRSIDLNSFPQFLPDRLLTVLASNLKRKKSFHLCDIRIRKTIEIDASYQQTATPRWNDTGSRQTYLSAQILGRTSTPRYNLYGKYGLSFLLFHNLCAYRAGCGANAYCEVGFDKTTGEERPVCLCNPGYVGKEKIRVETKSSFRENQNFVYFV